MCLLGVCACAEYAAALANTLRHRVATSRPPDCQLCHADFDDNATGLRSVYAAWCWLVVCCHKQRHHIVCLPTLAIQQGTPASTWQFELVHLTVVHGSTNFFACCCHLKCCGGPCMTWLCWGWRAEVAKCGTCTHVAGEQVACITQERPYTHPGDGFLLLC